MFPAPLAAYAALIVKIRSWNHDGIVGLHLERGICPPLSYTINNLRWAVESITFVITELMIAYVAPPIKILCFETKRVFSPPMEHTLGDLLRATACAIHMCATAMPAYIARKIRLLVVRATAWHDVRAIHRVWLAVGADEFEFYDHRCNV
jgi:hypothetical protein